jgi:2-amino-4-hydroxy-6-hydroxymethyldihydropteridine diphosphokinase
MSAPEIAFVGLGANLGDREATIASAVRALRRTEGVEVTAASRLLETRPVGPVRQGRFLNGVVRLRTVLPPAALLRRCLAIERDHGRDRSREQRWGPRTLDLDLLLYGQLVIDEPGLTLPHPRMHERAFVLIPLSEIAPQARHPVLGLTAAALRERLAMAL